MKRFHIFTGFNYVKVVRSIVIMVLSLSLTTIFALPSSISGVSANSGVWQPTSVAPIHWQWQIGTPFNIKTDVLPNVTVYDLDGFDTSAGTVSYLHAQGDIVIAYFSFGTAENWRPDYSQFTASVKGKTNGWPGENWLDIRSPVVQAIMATRMDLAKSKGFDAIEPDNIDGYSNSTGFPLTAQDQLNYNEWIATTAHAKGLSVGLKNDIEQIQTLQPFFDWCLNEQSYQYDEYTGLASFTNNNKAVFEVEYGKSTPQTTAMNSLHINSMTRDLDLVSPGSSGYVRMPCIPDTLNTWTAGSQPPVNNPPVLQYIGNKTVTQGNQLQFTVTGSDPNGDIISYSATNLPAGASFSVSNHTFSWTPTVAGTYPNVTFIVSDGKLTVSENISITVNPANYRTRKHNH